MLSDRAIAGILFGSIAGVIIQDNSKTIQKSVTKNPAAAAAGGAALLSGGDYAYRKFSEKKKKSA